MPCFPWTSGPKLILTLGYFPSAWFLKKTCLGTFPSASQQQHVEKSHFTVPGFPQPSGPKQTLTSVYFPLAWFLKKLVGVHYPQLQGTNM